MPHDKPVTDPVITAPPSTRFADVCGHRLEYIDIPAAAAGQPTLLFLHEGLGSVSLWRDFPALVARTTGCRTIVYSRYGHGRSSARHLPYTVYFMHDEATRVLPALRQALAVERPVLIGHSNGASMALIHAGETYDVTGVIAMAPFAFVEESNLVSIRLAGERYRTTDMRQKLARYHDDVDTVFWGWNEIWLNPGFKSWNIESSLDRIRCPLLAILGEADEYSTPAQIEAIKRHTVDAKRFACLRLADCGHSPHRDQPALVSGAIKEFVDRLC